jgi:membrane associated rhomboid family serine protease
VRYATKLRKPRTDSPVVTYALIGINVLVWVLQILPNSVVTNYLVYAPYRTLSYPWEMISSGFAHDPGGPLHLLFNMYSLFIFGRALEPMLGRGRFAALYLLSLFGGSVAVLLIAPSSYVLGASGAIFGLMAAYFVVARSLGANSSQFLGIIVLNLALGFFVSGISWQAHVGGLTVGAVVAFLMMQSRNVRKANQQVWLLGAVAVGLVVLTFIGVSLLPAG